MEWMRVILVAAALVSFMGRDAAAGPAAAAPIPGYAWDDKFLTGPPRDLQAVARSASDPTAGYYVLFQERRDVFSADGRCQSRFRRAFKVLTEASVRGNDLEAGWAPWHETQPVMRARVVTKDGKVFVLDPKTIEISGGGSSGGDMYSDRRLLRAALPGLAVGAVVEEEISWESQPTVAGLGMLNTFLFDEFAPVQSSRLIVDLPRALPLHVLQRPAEAVPMKRTETGDRVRVVFESGPSVAAEIPDEGWPNDVPIFKSVRYSTGPSWRDVANRYGELVDRQLAGADVRAWVAEARGRAPASRNELIARLVARLHKEVRYTGVEFGDASIVPRKPEEVLARGYGDCKDKAALLVALLRAAGVTAHVALLRVTGLDVEPAVPSLDGFDHAIVYVAPAGKAPAVWIDATNPYAPVGELPGGDVERFALVTSRGNDTLVKTPLAAAGDSRVRETRRVLMSETDPPRIIERTQAQGAAARHFRQSWSAASPKDLETSLASYVKDEYKAKALTRFDVGSPADLTKPLALEIEASDAEIGSVWDDGAQVLTRAGQTLSRLPLSLRSDKDDSKQDKKSRKVDFVIQERYQYELRYEIVPPHGFAADPLPPASTRNIGTASLKSTFSLAPGEVVIATFTFDSGKRRLSPAEFETFRAEVKEFWHSNAAAVRFHSTGSAALASGKVRDALAIFRKLDADHPRQALHARQIAETVLATGLGQVARDQARRALAADTKSADGERMVGWTLEHDLLGRRFGPGADVAGAEQAYRRAIALDPKHTLARTSLAVLLEHDADGEHTFPTARLAEVAKIYEALEKEGTKGFELNHTLALLYLERFKSVMDRTRAAESGKVEDNAVFLAALAATQGAPAALREASTRLAGNAQRAEIVRMAAAELMRLRRYPEATAFFDQAARDHTNGPALRMLAEVTRRTRRSETVKPDLRKPADVVRALFIEVFKAQAENRLPNRTTVANLVTPELVEELTKKEAASALRQAARAIARATGGISLITVGDMISQADFEAEGGPGTGYRVRMSMGDTTSRMVRVMVRADPAGPRVVCIGDDRVSMAREVMRLRRAGRLDGARAWLDWLLEGESLGTPTDPLSGSILARVWMQDDASRTAEAIDLAAAVLLASSYSASKDDLAQIIPILQQAHKASGGDRRGDACGLALVLALRQAERFAEAEPITADLLKHNPRSTRATGLRVSALVKLHRNAEALRIVEADVKARPNDPEAIRFLANVQLDIGNLAAAEAAWGRAAASPRAIAADHNMLAWLKLCRGDISDAVLGSARRSVELSGRNEAAFLHTLAAVLAERDEPERAREVLVETLDRRSSQELTDADRYVLGRIAESHAFLDTARDIYRQMQPPKDEVKETSSYMLAHRRLGRMAASSGAGGPPASVTKSAR